MAIKDASRVRATYGRTWAKTGKLEVSKEFLDEIGLLIVSIVRTEARNEFAKRGWSGKDPMGGPDIGDSFKHEVVGDSTIVIKSSFYGITELTSDEGIPERRMTWLTQNRSGWKPPTRKAMVKAPKPKGTRKPLVVPLTASDGEVIFRMAPLTMADAWIHPGIARFTFMERALRKGRKLWEKMIAEWTVEVIAGGFEEATKRG
jgi:hypothetical protein